MAAVVRRLAARRRLRRSARCCIREMRQRRRRNRLIQSTLALRTVLAASVEVAGSSTFSNTPQIEINLTPLPGRDGNFSSYFSFHEVPSRTSVHTGTSPFAAPPATSEAPGARGVAVTPSSTARKHLNRQASPERSAIRRVEHVGGGSEQQQQSGLHEEVLGLKNPGVMCYVTALLQCLAACPPLRLAALSSTTNHWPHTFGAVLLNQLRRLLTTTSNKRNSEPLNLTLRHRATHRQASCDAAAVVHLKKSLLSAMNNAFHSISQQCIWDYFDWLVERWAREDVVAGGVDYQKDAELGHPARAMSLPYRLFGGLRVEERKCADCLTGFSTHRDWSTRIRAYPPAKPTRTLVPLEDLWAQDFETEVEGFKECCSICCSKRRSSSRNKRAPLARSQHCPATNHQRRFDSFYLLPPPILCVALGRVRRAHAKDEFPVEVPQTLRGDVLMKLIHPEVQGQYRALEYNLVSFAVHHGKHASYGHYSAYRKTESGRWYEVDDETVRLVSNEQEVIKAAQSAVMFFYAASGSTGDAMLTASRTVPETTMEHTCGTKQPQEAAVNKTVATSGESLATVLSPLSTGKQGTFTPLPLTSDKPLNQVSVIVYAQKTVRSDETKSASVTRKPEPVAIVEPTAVTGQVLREKNERIPFDTPPPLTPITKETQRHQQRRHLRPFLPPAEAGSSTAKRALYGSTAPPPPWDDDDDSNQRMPQLVVQQIPFRTQRSARDKFLDAPRPERVRRKLSAGRSRY